MKKIGQKAESLAKLKKDGLFRQALLLLPDLPPFKEFCDKLNRSGFKQGDRIGVRFSSAIETMNLPRSIIIESYAEAYEFIRSKLKPELAVIVQGFVTAKYSGTFMKQGSKYYLSIINGVWEAETASNCDNIIIENNQARCYISTKPKECLFEEGNKLILKKVANKPSLVAEDIKDFWARIQSLDWLENHLYEFIIMPDNDFTIMEYKKAGKSAAIDLSDNGIELLQVKCLEDLSAWDKQQNILLAAPMSRENSQDFFQIIKLIEPYIKKVYISYGICSHPAVILREAGFKTIYCPNNPSCITLDLDRT